MTLEDLRMQFNLVCKLLKRALIYYIQRDSCVDQHIHFAILNCDAPNWPMFRFAFYGLNNFNTATKDSASLLSDLRAPPDLLFYPCSVELFFCSCNVWKSDPFSRTRGISSPKPGIFFFHQLAEMYLHKCFTRKTLLGARVWSN